MEVRLDPRLLTLAAALTAASAPAHDEHELVTDTRTRLAPFATHPSVQWLTEQQGGMGLLGLAMQAVQLGAPPAFELPPPGQVPRYVEAYFDDVPRDELAEALWSFSEDANVSALLTSQESRWQAVAAAATDALAGAELEPFQRLFYGRFPYTAVFVPLWNMASHGLRGVGVANVRETYAVCLPTGPDSLRNDQTELLILAQHEASHPILDDIQSEYADVPGACLFAETSHPPAGRFAQAYGDPEFRWVETVIRASTFFYLDFIGREADAEAFVTDQVASGVTAVPLFVDALRPWWRERRNGTAPGLDAVLGDLPGWLREASARLG